MRPRTSDIIELPDPELLRDVCLSPTLESGPLQRHGRAVMRCAMQTGALMQSVIRNGYDLAVMAHLDVCPVDTLRPSG